MNSTKQLLSVCWLPHSYTYLSCVVFDEVQVSLVLLQEEKEEMREREITSPGFKAMPAERGTPHVEKRK